MTAKGLITHIATLGFHKPDSAAGSGDLKAAIEVKKVPGI